MGDTWIAGRAFTTSPSMQERQVIPVVYYTDDKGKTVEFVSADVKASKEQLEKGEHRAMDCIDCHNRPTHAFELPENAVDLRMSRGLISPDLPLRAEKSRGAVESELSGPRHRQGANYRSVSPDTIAALIRTFTTRNARLWSRPPAPPPIFICATFFRT